MTKLLTSISVLQNVSRGLLSLDAPVDDILPEFGREPMNQIITGFESDNNGKERPVLKPSTKSVTLRHLLTHSSGVGYAMFDPLLTRYWTEELSREQPDIVNKTVAYSYELPRVFEAGEGWTYGGGVDWAGKMVSLVLFLLLSLLS